MFDYKLFKKLFLIGVVAVFVMALVFGIIGSMLMFFLRWIVPAMVIAGFIALVLSYKRKT